MVPFDALMKNFTCEAFWVIDSYLSGFPINALNDFEVVAEALKSLTEPQNTHKVPIALVGRIARIKEVLDAFEISSIPDRAKLGFKQLILQQVAWKIDSLSILTQEEKEKYLADQKLLRERIVQTKLSIPSSGSNEEPEKKTQDRLQDDTQNDSVMLFSEWRALHNKLKVCKEMWIILMMSENPPQNEIKAIMEQIQDLKNRLSQVGLIDEADVVFDVRTKINFSIGRDKSG